MHSCNESPTFIILINSSSSRGIIISIVNITSSIVFIGDTQASSRAKITARALAVSGGKSTCISQVQRRLQRQYMHCNDCLLSVLFISLFPVSHWCVVVVRLTKDALSVTLLSCLMHHGKQTWTLVYDYSYVCLLVLYVMHMYSEYAHRPRHI